MRALPLILLAALVVAPAAAAQGQLSQTATSVVVEPVEAALEPGAAVTTPVRVEYNYPRHGGASQGDTRIALSVPEAPEWVTATVEPAEVTVTPEMTGDGGAGQAVAYANLTVTVAEDAPMDAAGAVKVLAEAEANEPFLAASQGETTAEVRTAAPELPVNGTGGNGTAEASDAAADNGVPGPSLALAVAAAGAAALVRRGGRPPRGSRRRGPSR